MTDINQNSHKVKQSGNWYNIRVNIVEMREVFDSDTRARKIVTLNYDE